MNVLYTCDNDYLWLMGISVISLFENNKGIEEIDIYLLGKSVANANKEILEDIGNKYNRKITIIDVPQLDIPETLISARWPLSAFIRLYAGELLPRNIEKILYLDCDTIVKGQINDLDSWNVSGKIFWGIKDCIGKEYKKNIGIEPDGLYVNAGVLLMNLKELRMISIKDKLSSYMGKYQKLINYADQDVLNGVFHGMIGILPAQYDVMTITAVYGYDGIQKLRKPTNYYSRGEIEVALREPVIIHYTTNMRAVRPWFSNTNHPFADEFRKYMSMSPWKNHYMDKMEFKTKGARIVGIVEKLPESIAMNILGFLHAELKPIVIRNKVK